MSTPSSDPKQDILAEYDCLLERQSLHLHDAMQNITQKDGLGTSAAALRELSQELAHACTVFNAESPAQEIKALVDRVRNDIAYAMVRDLDALLLMLGQSAREIDSIHRRDLLDIHLFVREHVFACPEPVTLERLREILDSLVTICRAMRLEYEYHMPHEERLHYPLMPPLLPAGYHSPVPLTVPWLVGKVSAQVTALKEAYAAGSARNGASPKMLNDAWLAPLLTSDVTIFHSPDKGLVVKAASHNWSNITDPDKIEYISCCMHHYRKMRQTVAELLAIMADRAEALGSSLVNECNRLRKVLDEAVDVVTDAPGFVKSLRKLLLDSWPELVENRQPALRERKNGSLRRGRPVKFAKMQQAELGVRLVQEGRQPNGSAAARYVVNVIAPENPIKWADGYPRTEQGIAALTRAINRKLN
ncbi:MAG: hypothetical protein MJ240_12885 [Kiritimatiellae bacterium]|nr:hypothetical protein [Kiritimatiellia bacterium]